VNGYYNALDAMVHAMIEKGFAREKILKLYYLADGPEAALQILEGRLNA
jgi:predicted Rossmann-fold nucleotide-binding protein